MNGCVTECVCVCVCQLVTPEFMCPATQKYDFFSSILYMLRFQYTRIMTPQRNSLVLSGRENTPGVKPNF
jgi:hypothetical protein